jgi:hypothetical protein
MFKDYGHLSQKDPKLVQQRPFSYIFYDKSLIYVTTYKISFWKKIWTFTYIIAWGTNTLPLSYRMAYISICELFYSCRRFSVTVSIHVIVFLTIVGLREWGAGQIAQLPYLEGQGITISLITPQIPSGRGDPTSSYASVGVTLEVLEVRKLSRPVIYTFVKVEIPSWRSDNISVYKSSSSSIDTYHGICQQLQYYDPVERCHSYDVVKHRVKNGSPLVDEFYSLHGTKIRKFNSVKFALQQEAILDSSFAFSPSPG